VAVRGVECGKQKGRLLQRQEAHIKRVPFTLHVYSLLNEVP
jgi:hypothetical protein